MSVYRYIPGLTLLLIFLSLSACGSPNGQSPISDTPTHEIDLTSLPTPAETIVPQVTDTDSPIISPLPTSAQITLLSADPAVDPHLFESFRHMLEQLATEDGMHFEVHSSADLQYLNESLRLVVALPPDPGIEALAASWPQVDFLAIGIPGLQPTPNLSVIHPLDEIIDQVSFLAGYIAAVVTPEWRVGVIGNSTLPDGSAARQAFQNGVVFFCGLCQQSHPPYHRYPLYADTNMGADDLVWKSAADELISMAVRTVFIAPGAGNDALLTYLASEGVNLIGSGPPPEEVRDHWVASIRVDYISALSESWPDLLAAGSGITIPLPILIEDVNQDLFTPGRQLLVEKLLPDLLSGFVDTGVDPRTGQSD